VRFLDLLMPFLLAALLAFFIGPVVDRMEGVGFSRSGAVVALYGVAGLLLVLLWWGLAPLVSSQIDKFQRALPGYVTSVEHVVSGFRKDLKRWESQNALVRMAGLSTLLSGTMEGGGQQVMGWLGQAAGSVSQVAASVVEWMGDLALAPFLAFFFLRDGPKIKKALIRAVPNRYFEMALSIHYEVDRQIRSFFKGQCLEAMGVGLLAWIGLWWIGLNYAFFVGLVAGLTNLIPYIGPLVGSVVGVAVALIDGQSILLAVKVVAVLMAVQFLDSALLSTLIVGYSVDLHPVLIVLAVIVGGKTMGVMGMLLGVPLLAATVATIKILARGFEAYRI